MPPSCTTLPLVGVQRFYETQSAAISSSIRWTRGARSGLPQWRLKAQQEATTIAQSLYPPAGSKKSNSSNKEFFYRTPAQIFAHLLREGPTPHELAKWMADESFLQTKVKETKWRSTSTGKRAPRAADLSRQSWPRFYQSLRLLPKKEEGRGPGLGMRPTGQRACKGSIFITSKKSQREVLRPLISLSIDILVMRLMGGRPSQDKEPVWFVIDGLGQLAETSPNSTAP